jgi:hypothetical protein
MPPHAAGHLRGVRVEVTGTWAPYSCTLKNLDLDLVPTRAERRAQA